MAAVLSRWVIRDYAKARDWGLAALQFCRAQRGTDGVEASRYWFSTATEISILTELKPGVPVSGPDADPEVAKALVDLSSLATNTSTEVWADARAGADTLTSAGS